MANVFHLNINSTNAARAFIATVNRDSFFGINLKCLCCKNNLEFLFLLVDSADGAQGISTDETDYSALFETSRFGSSFESDDEDKIIDRNRSKSSPTHVAQAGSPFHFGLAQVCNYSRASLTQIWIT